MRRLGMTAIAAAVAIAAPARAGLPKEGELAPDFTLTLVDGTKVKRDELKGKVVVLNFWATWCVPCRTELPLLDAFYKLNAKHGLRMFAVTTEDSVPIGKLKGLFAVMAIPAVRRTRGPYAEVRAVPMNYVIDRGGRIRYAKAGSFDLDELNKTLVPLLRELAPPGTQPS